ncbi:IS3 family transposase [Bacillus sp. DTU_2020_1000418_1_SI_GHA_SEK_038]|uniref:IS3 family transposase n=1 Tax=Bacillus sp. DTU_2020_1000418_1_SI_GHA_SEK_038 TaxID=3077585 RepID=UPI0028E26FEF|nr:IS3 family transposase [Bacillus sp. DTU_2020_1000418_1_SI_GHA_SEK_038]WNS73662.1 IS3 family transposase [Bacillus sp. DTU_2020_1000418_1_SI_GHA_SEK_038]
MSKRAYSAEEKYEILKALGDEHSTHEIALIYKVHHSSILEWRHKFDKFGLEGLKESSTWKKYSKELKLLAIKDYLSGDYSMREITRMYEISDVSVLRGWIRKYNSHSEIKDTSQGRTNSMTKGRKTTWEERIQIVLDCLGNGKDYQEAANTYNVSYQQVYQWVKKYEDGGDKALKDKRGNKKEEAKLTPEEKIKLHMKKLERENERLRAENLFFKKVRGDRKEAKISQIRFEDKYIAIQELHEKENLSISLLCEIAEIARSAYYKWLNRTPSSRELLNEEIIKEMKILHEKVDSTFGYRQMTLHMNRKFQEKLNHKRIYRLMKVVGLRSVIRIKKKQYKRTTPQHVAENILNREFTAEKPNEKWVTDVTELKYGLSKKAYLSAIRDLYDGSIVSYVLGHSNNNQLVFKTLDQATVLLDGEHPLIHSDRGFQYTSKGFKRKIDAVKMTQSMSRVGRCIDNGPMESFWGTLKCEKYYLHKYKTFEELSLAIDDYIHFYNHDRYQKRLNGLSPMEYRAKAA